MTNENLCSLALSHLGFFHLPAMHYMLEQAGSAEALFAHKADLREICPDCRGKILELFNDSDKALQRAEEELAFCEKHHIHCLTIGDDDYPQRLRYCDDAPLALFYLGSANLNAMRIISIVGTRRCSQYGKDLVARFINELKEISPHTIIVSGLAYGIDICAHRHALQNGFETIGVLAHGLDMLYPAAHRTTAKQMVLQGGLLTEHFSHSKPDREYFLRRNRIVAGIADATIVVESAERGGSLATARIANDYNRDVFAFPGRISDECSAGCNKLINSNQAHLLLNAEEFAKNMQWQEVKKKEKKHKDIQLELFPDLNESEQRILATLRQNNDLHINTLSLQSQTPIPQLASLLLDLELKGLIRELPGGVFHSTL